jgi:hypothetical protein
VLLAHPETAACREPLLFTKKFNAARANLGISASNASARAPAPGGFIR